MNTCLPSERGSVRASGDEQARDERDKQFAAAAAAAVCSFPSLGVRVLCNHGLFLARLFSFRAAMPASSRTSLPYLAVLLPLLNLFATIRARLVRGSRTSVVRTPLFFSFFLSSFLWKASRTLDWIARAPPWLAAACTRFLLPSMRYRRGTRKHCCATLCCRGVTFFCECRAGFVETQH